MYWYPCPVIASRPCAIIRAPLPIVDVLARAPTTLVELKLPPFDLTAPSRLPTYVNIDATSSEALTTWASSRALLQRDLLHVVVWHMARGKALSRRAFTERPLRPLATLRHIAQIGRAEQPYEDGSGERSRCGERALIARERNENLRHGRDECSRRWRSCGHKTGRRALSEPLMKPSREMASEPLSPHHSMGVM